MAEAFVFFAIERISDLLIHEAVYLSGVREEVECLSAELKRMQCFLKDADRKQEKDERLRNRVAEIRDLAYDAEDVIDTFILKVARQSDFLGINKCFTSISISTKPLQMHKIGMNVKTIQKKLEDISMNLAAYQISGEGEGSTSISRMQQRLRRAYSHVEEEDVVSLESMTKDVLVQLMKEEDRLHVVSIVGMGGIGKTTLAREVYNHNDVKRHFDCFAWAFISQKCMPREVLHEVLIKVISPSKEERKLIDKLTENELMIKLFHVLEEKRYLIVLDDIWKIQDWEILKKAFPRGKKGSKILFTTRNRRVALHADPCNSPIEVPRLTPDESWSLFKRKAFPENTTESHARSREFEMLGREMVIKCEGLPLAIVVLGGLLATKKSRAEWEMVQRNIHADLNKAQDGEVNGILVLSYNDLPYHLKPCFLYLGHYPEDWEISKKELIRLWIAEGFISPSLESRGMLMEDVAEEFLEELINRCLVQVGKSDYTGVGVKTCRIHDLLRDLCVGKAREENFFEIFQPPLIENSTHSPDVILTASKQRRISIHTNKRYVCLKGENPNLRSLLLFQNESLIELDISKCKNFKLLRVLKVVKKDDKWHVASEIGNLYCLRYLGLQCFGSIILPASIEKLKNLHTLHVRSERLNININAVFKLKRLRHLLLFDNRERFPLGAERCLGARDFLKNIETLKYIWIQNLNENDAVISFTNIRSLGIIFKRSEDVVHFLKALMQFHCLRSLDLNMMFLEVSSQSYPYLEPLSQCHHLSKLSLRGKIQNDPHSMHHVLKFVPANIVKLTLYGSELKQDPMAVLEKLPHLRILKLFEEAYTGTKLICSANGFLQLDSLEIEYLPELEKWEIEEGAMLHLRSLKLDLLPNFSMVPEGLRYLTALQELKLHGMKRSLVERIEVIDGREGEDFSKVSHIPSIQIFRTED